MSDLDRSYGFRVPVLTEDANLRDALGRIAALGHQAVPSAVGASITLIERGRSVTMGSSNELAVELDVAQYDARDGPCLTAAREMRTIMTTAADAEVPEGWRLFRAACRRVGVAGSMSVPLMLGDDVEGGFNLYMGDAASVGPADLPLVSGFASHAAAIVLNARAYWAAAVLSQNLAVALETRGVIERAKGVLMGAMGITANEAFDELRKRSQRENRKLNVVAADLVGEPEPEEQ